MTETRDVNMNEILIASSVNQRLKGEELKVLNYLSLS
jgi:hypothetical protein